MEMISFSKLHINISFSWLDTPTPVHIDVKSLAKQIISEELSNPCKSFLAFLPTKYVHLNFFNTLFMCFIGEFLELQ